MSSVLSLGSGVKRTRFVLHDRRDINRLTLHLFTHWNVPRIEGRVALPELEVQRAQHRIDRLCAASGYQSTAAVLGVITLLLGVAHLIRNMDESLLHVSYVLLAALWAALMGRVIGT